MKRVLYASLLVSTVSALGTSAAFAQAAQPEAAAPSGGLGDIVVTARRRAESLQSVPVSVSAVSAEALQNNRATDLTKIAELAPQVIIGRQTIGTGAIIAIRGISSTSSDPGLDQSAAVAIDGIVLSRGRIVSSATFDIAQVEVLEGPQALFFGKNSPAGVISISSVNPTNDFEGYIRGGYEFNARERYLEAAVSGPITDSFKARFAFKASDMDGWTKNVAKPIADFLHPGVITPGQNSGARVPAGQDYAGRLTLVYSPGNDFDATLKVVGQRQKINAMDAFAESFCTGGQTIATVLGRPDPYADCKKDQVKSESGLASNYSNNYTYGNNGVPYYITRGLLTSLNLNKKFGDITATSTTGFYRQTYSGTNNADYTSFALIWSAQFEKYNLFTQEWRLNSDLDGPLNFAGGAYYEHSWRSFGNFPDLLHAGLNVAANNYTTIETLAKAFTTTVSAFGQVRWEIVPTLELAAGARYSHDKKKQNAYNRTVGVGAGYRPAGSVITSRFSDDNVSPEVTLSWKPAPRQLIYGAYKTGYKAGAISNGALLTVAATSQNLVIGSEKARGFEVGYKGDLLNNHLRFNLTGYRYVFKGLQLGTFNSVTTSFTIQNAAAARTTGVQASLNYLITEGLTFNGNLGYNKAIYTNFPDAQCYTGQTAAQGCIVAVTGQPGRQNLSGARLNRAPELTYNVGLNYKVPLGSWKADIGVDGTHTASYMTAADNNPGGRQDAFWRLNASVHIGPEDDRFRFSLIGRNLTNSYYLITTSNRPLGTANEYIGIFNRPREVALQAEMKF